MRILKIRLLILALLLIPCPGLVSATTVTEVQDAETGFSAVVVTVPPADNHGFFLLDVPEQQRGDNIRHYWNAAQYQFMTNGGYFNEDFSPTGQCRINGMYIKRGRSPRLYGFVALDAQGSLRVVTRHSKLNAYPTLLQSGPFVIAPGGRVGIRSRTGYRARRTLIGTTRKHEVIIMVTDPIFLLDLAEAVHKQLPQIERLLNLDGGSSTALMARDHIVINRSAVRNYLGKRNDTPQKKPTGHK